MPYDIEGQIPETDEPLPPRHLKLRTIGALIILVALTTAMLTCFVSLSHGATTRPRPNSLGLSQSYTNPYVYMFGTIQHIEEFGKATSVTFRPFGASLLTTQEILFCGNLSMLENATEDTFYIFTYRQVASQTYRGVACHDLFRVTELSGDQR